MFDSAGHPTNPADRLAGLPTPVDDVQPITIGDNVWIGGSCIIYPGVTIGNGSVISMGSVVTANVPANVLVMGNPARQILSLVGTPSPVCKL
jgi:acetyltransferase-like isoleucine patch superfamily enzyme